MQKHFARIILISFFFILTVLSFQNCSQDSFQMPSSSTKSSTGGAFTYNNLTDSSGALVVDFPKAQAFQLQAKFSPGNLVYNYIWKFTCVTASGNVNTSSPEVMPTVTCDGTQLQVVVTVTNNGKSASSPLINLFPRSSPPPSAINFNIISNVASATVNTCINNLSLQLLDSNGALKPAPASISAQLAATGFSFFSSVDCSGASTSSLTFNTGISTISFSAKASQQGTYTVQATASGVGTGSRSFVINPANAVATKVLLQAQPNQALTGTCLKVSVSLDANPSGNVTVNLSQNKNAQIFNSSACATSITSVALSQSTPSVDFYVKDSTAETATISATSSGLTSTSQDLIFTAPANANAVVLVGSDTMKYSDCAAYKVMLVDANDNTKAKTVTSDTVVTLSANSTNFKYYSTSTCSISLSTPTRTIYAGTSESAVYVKDASVEKVSVTSSANNMTSLVKNINVTSQSGGFTGALDFGGMYGNWQYGNYVNPATNAMSCPAGYSSQQVKGSPNKDYNLYFCWRNHVDGQNSLYDFGGMYGDSATGGYINPATSAKNCPVGYTDLKVFGSPNMDYDVHYCYRNFDGTKTDKFEFSGMWGQFEYGSYPNPVTAANTCLGGYTQQQFHWSNNMDWPSYFCYKNVGTFTAPPQPDLCKSTDTNWYATIGPCNIDVRDGIWYECVANPGPSGGYCGQ